MARSREEKNAQNRELYHWYKSHGICIQCLKRTAQAGKVRCEICSAKQAEHATARRYTERAKEQKRKSAKKIYDRRKADGMCVACGKRKAVRGVRCLDCYVKMMRITEKRNSDRREEARIRQEERYDNKLCCRCGNPVYNDMKLCKRHYDIAVQNLKPAREALRRVWKYGND